MAAIAGAGLLLAATMLHPMAADPGDAVAAFKEYAADTHWAASHLGQFFGVVLLFVAILALADTIGDSRHPWLTRLGIHFGVAAVAGAAVLQAIDGVALKAMVDLWANAPADQKQSGLSASLAVRHIEIGVAAYARLLFGAAVGAISGATVTSTRYPAWLTWLGLIGGLGTIVAGVSTAFTGFSALTMAIGMPADLLIMSWVSIAGVLMWRHAV